MREAPALAANDIAKQGGLSDALRTLRGQRGLIVALVVFGALAALVLSAAQSTTYQGQASVAFADQSRDLGIVGNVPVAAQSPDQVAAAGASTIGQPAVLQLAAQMLRGAVGVDQLRSSFSALIDPRSSLVVITASAHGAQLAAAIANALANAVVSRAVTDARAGYAVAAQKVRAQLVGLGTQANAAAERTALAEELSRLVSLSVLAQPAQVAQTAPVPSSPSSPKPVRNAILGGLFGLIVGLLAAMLRSSVDRRLRDPDEVRVHMDLPLLTQIDKTDLGQVPYLTPEGSDHANSHSMEAFSILRTNLAFLSGTASLRTIAVTSAIPEEGKSTVAISLACASAAAGRLTLLIDCDLRRPSVAERLNLAPAPGLTDYLSGLANPEDVLQSVPLTGFNAPSTNGHRPTGARECQVTCITAGSPHPHPAELLGAEGRLSTFLAEVAQTYEMVVIDTSPLLPVADTRELLPFVDAILLCVRANLTSREDALAGKAALAKLPPRPTGLVVTGVDGRDSYYGYYGE